MAHLIESQKDSLMKLPLVSYVIITMNRQEELAGCLSNLYEQNYHQKQIVVVDNGSTDDTVNMIREQFPEVYLVALNANQGVAGGRNRGVEAAKGEICIFIDDDARMIDPQATKKTVAYFQADPELACVAFLIRNAFTGIEDYKAIPRIDKRLIKEDYPCSYFCGAGFALRRQVFIDLGMFWEKLIYGGEELDFSYRLLDQGYRLIHSVSIEVAHREVPHARPKGQWVYFNVRNRCWVAAKNLSWIYVVSTSLLWWVRAALVSIKWRHFGFFARGVRDGIRGLPSVIRERQCIHKATVQKLKQLSGRLWY